jgi:putative transcriptional regulator
MHWELIRLRKINKVSQDEMAKRLGINIRTYSMKENGDTDFKLEEIFTIAKLFDKRIEEIFLPRNIRNTDKKITEGR